MYRVIIDRRAVVQEIHDEGAGIHFRTESPVLLVAGSQLWVEGDELVVTDAAGSAKRYRGTSMEPREGDKRLGFVIGHSTDTVE